MNTEVLIIAATLKDAYEGDPWYGKSAKKLLDEINEADVFEKPSGQNSMVELLWHMINWKEFTISRIREIPGRTLKDFEVNDWRIIEVSDRKMWPEGLKKYHELHNEMSELIMQQRDELLQQTVPGRKYDFRKLLNGIVQHDIYHLGQIAYIQKLLREKIER